MCKYTYILYAYIYVQRESERERFMAKTKPTFAETAFSGDNFSAVALQKQQHAHVNTTWDSYIKIQSPLLYFLFYCVGDMDWLPLSESQLGTEWMSGGNWCTQSARHPLILIHEHTLRFKRVWVLASEAWESSGFLCVPRRKVGHCHDALQSLFVGWKHSTSHTGWVTPVYVTLDDGVIFPHRWSSTPNLLLPLGFHARCCWEAPTTARHRPCDKALKFKLEKHHWLL